MACTNCSTKSDTTTPKGCGNKGSCATDSCNKLTVFDWLSNMRFPSNLPQFDVVEVRFKNGRKEYFKNIKKFSLKIGDVVATEASPGHDIGVVSLVGELVKTQLKKRKISNNTEFLRIYRIATQKDINTWQKARQKEEKIKKKARELAIQLHLEMKISDVEYQGDASKIVFYYTANDRVDFRQLIKEYAREFGVRIEMKQIGFRQEAARLGGVGSCGRELCCSTWLTDFRSVNTAAARYQQLSLNPQKLAGQCGKLKCCLNYELDTYLDALKGFPSTDVILKTKKGELSCQKIDIFKQMMWFTYPEHGSNWYQMHIDSVKKIIKMNKDNVFPNDVDNFVVVEDKNNDNLQIEEDNLSRFDNDNKKPNRNKRRRKKAATTTTNKQKEETQKESPKNNNSNSNGNNNNRRRGNRKNYRNKNNSSKKE